MAHYVRPDPHRPAPPQTYGINRDRAKGETPQQIAATRRLTIVEVFDAIAWARVEAQRDGVFADQLDDSTTTPTPSEIAAACREIQKTWTEEERERRRIVSVAELEVPTTRSFSSRRRSTVE